MSLAVADRGANKPELIQQAADALSRSPQRTAVFNAIYTGKQKVKDVKQLMKATKLGRVRVLDLGRELETHEMVARTKQDGLTAFKKIPFYQQHRDRILRLAKNRKARLAMPTKRSPRTGSSVVRMKLDVKVPAARVKVHQITVDDIDSFSNVRKAEADDYVKLAETKFKKGVAKILRERGTFNDWGGELRDLSSTRLNLKGKRRVAAFAFKGPGTTGLLTPGKMGKNGDQVLRLFRCPADVFVVQYWAEIDDAILEQMRTHATAKAFYENREIWFGIMDGIDSARLIAAYPSAFPGVNSD